MKRFLKYFSILFFITIFLIIGSVIILIGNNNKNVVTEENVREYLNSDQILNNPESGFSKLSTEEQAAYLRIVNEIENLNDSFYLTGNIVNEEQFNKITNLILNDHPDFFYIKNFEYVKNNEDLVESVNINYSYDENTIKQQKEEVEVWKNNVLSQITPDMSNYEIALYLHDYLVSTIDYDENVPNNQNILSIVESDRSVCAGYSRAYQYLLNEVGIFATYVSGDSVVGSHAWNLIEIDGEYMWVDLTWDDPSFTANDAPEGFISHTYFGLTTEELLRNREIDTTYINYGNVENTDFNYYNQENLYFDLDNFNEYNRFLALLDSYMNSGDQTYLEIKLKNFDQVDQLLSRLSYEPILNGGTINYISDAYYPTITFLIK